MLFGLQDPDPLARITDPSKSYATLWIRSSWSACIDAPALQEFAIIKSNQIKGENVFNFLAVLRIRIRTRRIRMLFGLQDPDPELRIRRSRTPHRGSDPRGLPAAMQHQHCKKLQ
jgi:hypothetical protein